MEKKITAEQQERLAYRLAMLRYKLKCIEDDVTGRGISYLPIITDADGIIDDEKLDAFISGLLDSLDHYIEICPDHVIDEHTREMYRKFLYVAVKTLKDRPNRRCPSVNITDWARTFGDIIEAAENVEIPSCKSYRQFLKIIYARYRNERSYLPELLNLAHEGLKFMDLHGYEDHFIDNLPRDIRLELCREFAEENDISDNENGVYVSIADDPEEFLNGWIKYQEEQAEQDDTPPEDLDRMIGELAEDYIKEKAKRQPFLDAVRSLDETEDYGGDELLSTLTDDEKEDYEHEAEFEHMIYDAIPHWLVYIAADHEAYLKNYTEFVRLYFDGDHSWLCRDIENMIDTYLFEHGISAFSFGDRYGLITHQLDRAKRHIGSEIERAKK